MPAGAAVHCCTYTDSGERLTHEWQLQDQEQGEYKLDYSQEHGDGYLAAGGSPVFNSRGALIGVHWRGYLPGPMPPIKELPCPGAAYALRNMATRISKIVTFLLPPAEKYVKQVEQRTKDEQDYQRTRTERLAKAKEQLESALVAPDKPAGSRFPGLRRAITVAQRGGFTADLAELIASVQAGDKQRSAMTAALRTLLCQRGMRWTKHRMLQ